MARVLTGCFVGLVDPLSSEEIAHFTCYVATSFWPSRFPLLESLSVNIASGV
jgi:hypothetical protein